jgi:hypothetical protein
MRVKRSLKMKSKIRLMKTSTNKRRKGELSMKLKKEVVLTALIKGQG